MRLFNFRKFPIALARHSSLNLSINNDICEHACIHTEQSFIRRELVIV